ncbi:hypothetical protein MACH24_09200 [Erythrobacter sp. Dej080120_24]|nr:hypothetical protein MACH24_09200 [Erythrobacter sp. Dej080120_24]
MGCLLTPAAHAQEAESEEADARGNVIIVTARKVEESLQDVPLAITAFTAEDIRNRSITSLQDIALQTPGFVYEDFSNGGYGTPTIRGANNFNITSLEQNVSVFIDGIYVPRQYSFDVATLGLERVEIVKGPQSALYGANAFAGAINYIVANRDLNDLQVSGTAGFSEDNGFDLAGKLNVPIIEGMFSMRLAGSMSKYGGSIPNNHPNADLGIDPGTQGNFGGYDDSSIRVGATFEPTDMITLDFDYYRFNVDKEVHAGYRIESRNGDMNCGSGPRLFCGELPVTPIPGPSGTPGYVQDPRSIGINASTNLYRAAAEVRLTDEITFNYLFGKINGDVFAGGNSDKDPLIGNVALGGNIFSYGPGGNFDYESHEARIQYAGDNGFYAMLGGFAQDGSDFDLFAAGVSPLRGTTPITAIEGLIVGSPAITDTKTRAIFGRIEVPLIGDQLSVSVEGRYTDEEKVLLSGGSTFNYSDSYFTPAFSIDYKITPDNMIYAKAGRGVKSGGANSSSFAGLIDAERFFGPDANWTYEIGSKNTFADGRGFLNVDLFYIDWSNLQVPQTPTGAPLNTATVTVNLGGAKSKGVEISADYELVPNFRVNAGLAYVDATYNGGVISGRLARAGVCDDVICAANGDVSGNQLQRQSPWQWNLGASYETPITDTVEMFARVDVFGQSSQFTDESNTATIMDRALVNARLGVNYERWSLAVWAKNLLNETYVANAFFTATPFGSNYVPSIGQKRRVGATLSFDF